MYMYTSIDNPLDQATWPDGVNIRSNCKRIIINGIIIVEQSIVFALSTNSEA